jgi:hypothetical protein
MGPDAVITVTPAHLLFAQALIAAHLLVAHALIAAHLCSAHALACTPGIFQ